MVWVHIVKHFIDRNEFVLFYFNLTFKGLTSPGGGGTLNGGDMHLVPPHPEDQPLCLFCEEDRLNKLLCEKEWIDK